MSYAPLNVDELRRLLGLPSAATKVALYLASRADSFGMSFPSVSTIAQECWMSVASVYRGLAILKDRDVVRVVRENERDMLTGKPMPNVYIVTDALIVIRPECREQYNMVWGHRGSQRRDDSHHGYTNQQQNQIQEPNTENQIQKPTTTTSKNAQKQGDDGVWLADDVATESPDMLATGEKDKGKKARNKNTPTQTQRTPPGSAATPPTKSGKSPFKPSGGYVDPDAIQQPLLDADEAVAVGVASLGIPVQLARGFVTQYGADGCQSALGVVRGQTDSTNPPGLFRYLIQKRLTVIKLPKPVTSSPLDDSSRYTTGKYAEYVES